MSAHVDVGGEGEGEAQAWEAFVERQALDAALAADDAPPPAKRGRGGAAPIEHLTVEGTRFPEPPMTMPVGEEHFPPTGTSVRGSRLGGMHGHMLSERRRAFTIGIRDHTPPTPHSE